MATIESIISGLESKIAANRKYVEDVLATAQRGGHKNLTIAQDVECGRRLDQVDEDKRALERAKAVQAEENSLESRLAESRSTGAYVNRQNRTTSMHITSEARTYQRR